MHECVLCVYVRVHACAFVCVCLCVQSFIILELTKVVRLTGQHTQELTCLLPQGWDRKHMPLHSILLHGFCGLQLAKPALFSPTSLVLFPYFLPS